MVTAAAVFVLLICLISIPRNVYWSDKWLPSLVDKIMHLVVCPPNAHDKLDLNTCMLGLIYL